MKFKRGRGEPGHRSQTERRPSEGGARLLAWPLLARGVQARYAQLAAAVKHVYPTGQDVV